MRKVRVSYSCYNCGYPFVDVVVSDKEDFIRDGDIVVCPDCSSKGCVSVDPDGSMVINWFDEMVSN